jgi:hypothetical protein
VADIGQHPQLGAGQRAQQRLSVALERKHAVVLGPGEQHPAADAIQAVGCLLHHRVQQVAVDRTLRGAEAVSGRGGVEPFGVGVELAKQQPASARRDPQRIGVREQAVPDRAVDR